SGRIGALYRELRGVPAENVLSLPLGTDRSLSRSAFEEKLARPAAAWLRDRRQIQVLVTTTGVPYTVGPAPDKPDSEAALDRELAAVVQPRPVDPTRWAPNPFFRRGGNPDARSDPRTMDLVMVSRLDGPDEELIGRLVRDAIRIEKEGLRGGVFADSRGF